ncbi:hypothetical protein [Exiguobacterium sp. s162]|uniref:hypothetical protein n=1 Tax=Exiguobacterium sp. s162 TaxID=2751276 RepID=UPI001BEA1D81|nr:hypothetical protein [Exiguobacterium sp. s162]
MVKKTLEFLLGIVAIYGMFFAKYYVTNETDDSYSIFGETYAIKGTDNVVLKDQLGFVDGLNNGAALLGHVMKHVFIGAWQVFMSLNDLIMLIQVGFLWKILLYFILIFISFIISMLLLFILFPIVAFKLLFFKATISYYLGFCLFFVGVMLISEILEKIENNEKNRNKPSENITPE